ncbi:leukocyte elastase inhibitor-like [Mercenaria mercenaria]|uniref:leukocyte elastase inhibitor-like n=1 Tax=Mercenaria mercenaria TaxID=6596 RepID=UPI00234E8AFC|nr:leukocyte elastase inhibitor-like [Mercenaria mercenaria]
MASSDKVLSDCINEFTVDIYKYVISEQFSGNVFMSPTSMMVVLTMLFVGARKKTEDQMTQILKLEKLDKKAVLRDMETFVNTLKKGSKSVTLSTANRLFPNTSNIILEDYISLVSEHFKAGVKSMDYTTNADGARIEINKWVERETNSKIKDLLPKGSLGSDTVMVVVNAIYFKGNWETQFEPKDTKKGTFTKLNSDKELVDMMSRHMKKVKYGENRSLACKTLELPYEGKELAMIIVLPRAHYGLPVLEKQLALENLRNLVSEIDPSTVDVSLPKFKLETSLKLKKVLSDLGMNDLFLPHANLSGMGGDLYVSEVYHKAFVDVNEEGTEATAATAAVVVTCSTKQTLLDFTADHPFLFMIWDHRLNVPLFIGRFVEPLNTAGPSFQQTKDEL